MAINNTTHRAVPPSPSTMYKHMANADTGTTGNFLALKDINCLSNVREATSTESISVQMPNGKEIKSSHTGELHYPNLPGGGGIPAHVFKELQGSLLDIGGLCDLGLKAVFDKTAVYIVNTECEEIVLSGTRDPDTRLWMIALQPITRTQENWAINAANIVADTEFMAEQKSLPAQAAHINAISEQKLDTAGDRVEHFSRVFCSAAESTLIKAVSQNWIRYPGITGNVLKRHRHRLRTHESAAGHLDQVQQNQKKGLHRATTLAVSNDEPQPINVLTYTHEERNHMDATGGFPVTSHRGDKYILIMYSEGGNYIKAITMKTRTKQSYLKAHKAGNEYFKERGYAPTFQRLDNETSFDFNTYLRSNDITIDLAPPHQHRRNKAERAIRTWKNHFIAALAGVDPSFPMCAWSELIEHMEITINLLRPSEAHPRMSAWEGMNGPYDFDAHPLAPPGIAVTIHEKSQQRSTWGKHGVPGFYVGPALQHYRCYTVWALHTGSVRQTDTLAWHPHGYSWEKYTPLDMVTSTAEVLATALHHLANSEHAVAAHQQPLQHIAHDINTNFKALQQLFNLPPTPNPAISRTIVSPTANQRVEEQLDSPINQRVEEQIDSPINQSVDESVDATTTEAVPISSLVSAPPATAQRSSQRRKHKWLNRTNAAAQRHVKECRESRLPYETRRAIAITDRATGKPMRKKPWRKPSAADVWEEPSCPTPARTRYINSMVYQARKLIQKNADWTQWAGSAGVDLDSNGVPFFLDTRAGFSHAINTAVDLDAQGKKLSMTTALSSAEGDIWLAKHGEEISRLFDSDTIRLIHRHELPAGKKPAYYNPQVRTKIKDGELQYRVRGTIGGNHVFYDGDTAAHTASMQLIKIFLNSVVSEKGAKFMTADIKDFYLGTPLPSPEYMRINLDHIPAEVIAKYNMDKYKLNGAIVVEVNKGIYGLPQAGILAQDRLIKHLAAHGYHQAQHTPCLFKHESNSVSFTLVVDDFGIKYTNDADADHLLKSLRELYIMTEDRAHKQKYVGITIDHDRQNHTIELSMPGYVPKAITRFGRAKQSGAKSPLMYVPFKFGKEQQMTPDLPPEAHEIVDDKTKTYVQEVTGVFLFYSRAVDPTMLTAVNKISSEQSKPTGATLKAVDRLLSYAERYPNASIVLTPSNMQLCVQSDASYNSESNARSRAGGILYFGLNADGSINGAIDHISCLIPTVCSSSAEAEYAALFLAGREATNARNILADLGYPQATTTIICDNSCAVGIANNSVKQKRSKAIDMRYHWIRDQVSQGKFAVTWEEGSANLADYFTKIHPVQHYVTMRRVYVTTPKPLVIRECARSRRVQNQSLAKAA